MKGDKPQLLCYGKGLITKKTDYLKDGLLEFLQNGPKSFDECVVEGGAIVQRSGFRGSTHSDDFRMRVFEKLHQLTARGQVTKDRSIKPPLFSAN